MGGFLVLENWSGRAGGRAGFITLGFVDFFLVIGKLVQFHCFRHFISGFWFQISCYCRFVNFLSWCCRFGFCQGGVRRTGFLLLENVQLFLKVITFSSVIWVGFRFKLGYFSIWVCLGEGDFG